MAMISGGRLLVESLVAHGVTRVFCVAGESYLPVLDAFLDFPEIDVVTCRHESGAAFMAEAHAQLTGQPGIIFVTRGPGACNASIGIHAARQSSVPVILFSGLIHSRDRGREAFQEFDIAAMFAPLAKDAFVIETIPSIPDSVVRAFHAALSGRPGPVVVGLPEDVLFEGGKPVKASVLPVSDIKPSQQDLKALTDKLAAAERPVVIVGGNLWKDSDCENLASFVRAAHLPVVTGFRQQDIMDHNHACYIGEMSFGINPKLLERLEAADLLLFLGARPDETTVQAYTLPKKGQKTIHVYPSAEVFGKSFTPDLAITAHAGLLCAVLAASFALDGRKWAEWCAQGRKEYLEWTTIKDEAAGWKGADMTDIMRQAQELFPRDAIVSVDAGNFAGWPQRYLRYARPGRFLGPVCGAMGYGVPAAVAASLQYSDRTVIGFCGDGGFMMTGQELATAIHHKVKPIIIVCNNSMYGTIRMHQEREFPGRVSGTALTNPDFVKLGESYGAFSARVNNANDFKKLWPEASRSGKAALIEIRMDPKQISTRSRP
ncbi:MAG: thiamine pyrophosphate-binding protein [Micavibrio sp.]|nr:thiamine pyrophosphate-binding protein [Micavibrio sp.]